ncbi:hypothetical protein Taro_015908, partial [Colocasia esculenta]|nr:hypothetical protein [Colocasia esculenta]
VEIKNPFNNIKDGKYRTRGPIASERRSNRSFGSESISKQKIFIKLRFPRSRQSTPPLFYAFVPALSSAARESRAGGRSGGPWTRSVVDLTALSEVRDTRTALYAED